MKILKIFGVVVAVHAAVFMFVFAIPGCRSTSRSVAPQPSDSTSGSPTVSYPGGAGPGPVAGTSGEVFPSMGSADLNPGIAGGSPVVAFNSPSSDAQRFNPTRPDSPAAGVLQSGAVGGVIPAKTYSVVSNDSLWKVAKKHGISIGELAAANNLRSNSPLKVGQKLIIPGKLPVSSSGNGGGSASGETLSYRVKAGESLGVIARRAGTTVATIRSLNPGLKNDVVRAGQELVLPAGQASAAAMVDAGPVSASSPRPASGGLKHTVKPGESVGQIARRYGASQRDILVANNIADPRSLQAGQVLEIPGAKADRAEAPESAATPPADVPPVAPAPDSPVAPAPGEASPVAPEAPPVMKVEEAAPVGPVN